MKHKKQRKRSLRRKRKKRAEAAGGQTGATAPGNHNQKPEDLRNNADRKRETER